MNRLCGWYPDQISWRNTRRDGLVKAAAYAMVAYAGDRHPWTTDDGLTIGLNPDYRPEHLWYHLSVNEHGVAGSSSMNESYHKLCNNVREVDVDDLFDFVIQWYTYGDFRIVKVGSMYRAAGIDGMYDKRGVVDAIDRHMQDVRLATLVENYQMKLSWIADDDTRLRVSLLLQS